MRREVVSPPGFQWRYKLMALLSAYEGFDGQMVPAPERDPPGSLEMGWDQLALEDWITTTRPLSTLRRSFQGPAVTGTWILTACWQKNTR
jgi:hypothetical protein